MSIIDTVRADLKGASMARQQEVAEKSGVPWSTLRKIVDGGTENPRFDTAQKLAHYYADNPPAKRVNGDASSAPAEQAA